MNFINNIEIKNFKSIRHQKIEGCKRINIFVGPPNVGKSNILEGLGIMSYRTNAFCNFKDLCRYDKLSKIFNDGDSQKNAEVIVNNIVYSIKYIFEDQIQFLIKENNPIFNHILENIDNRNDLISSFNINKMGVLSSWRSEIENFKNPIKVYTFRSNIRFDDKNNAKSLEIPFGQNLSLVLRHNEKVRKSCGELFSSFNLKLIFDEDDNIVIQKQLDEFTAFNISFMQMADTLQRLIFHKTAIASNENSVLLFEEPEANMYPPYISKFTSDIINDENNNQFFIATHSPFVLNDLMENAKDDLAIYLVDYKKETGETIINKMSDEDMHEAYQFGYDFFLNIKQFLPQKA